MDKSLKLLLVGDSHADAETVVAELGRRGFEVIWNRVDGEAELDSALQTRWDFVVSEYEMARLGGLRAFEVVRGHDTRVPFVFLSDALNPARAAAAMRKGVRDCLRRRDIGGLASMMQWELDHQGTDQPASLDEPGYALGDQALSARSGDQAGAAAPALSDPRHLFDASPVALLEVDLFQARPPELVVEGAAVGHDPADPALDGIRILAANAAAAELLGSADTKAALDARSWRAEERSLWHFVLEGLTEETGRAERELDLSTLDGRRTRVLLAFRRPARDGGLHHVVLSLTSLERPSRLRRETDAFRRMAPVAALAGRVAHDFNNYLTVIKGYTGLLLDTVPENDALHSDLAIIEKAAMQAEDLTGKLLRCSRPQCWQPEVLSLNHHVKRLLDTLRAAAGDEVDLVTGLADGLWHVEMDPPCLEQILVSLIHNGARAMNGRGRLRVETDNAHLNDSDASVVGAPPGDYVLLRVTDEGRGMDAPALERCFEPFFTAEPGSGDEGLGLSFVYGVVRQAGGLIKAHSEPGAGTTFDVLLPRRQATVA